MKCFLCGLLCVILVFYTFPVQASYWLKCDVKAKVTEASENGYHVDVLSSVVIDGHEEKGTPCLERQDEYNLEDDSHMFYYVEDQSHNVHADEEVELIYEHYSGRGPNGPVESTTWTLSP